MCKLRCMHHTLRHLLRYNHLADSADNVDSSVATILYMRIHIGSMMYTIQIYNMHINKKKSIQSVQSGWEHGCIIFLSLSMNMSSMQQLTCAYDHKPALHTLSTVPARVPVHDITHNKACQSKATFQAANTLVNWTRDLLKRQPRQSRHK